MKKYITAILFLLVCLNSKATAWEPDVIYLNGKKFLLMDCPLNRAPNGLLGKLEEAYHIEALRMGRNYTAYWSIKDNKVCLDSIAIVREEDKEEIVRAADSPLLKEFTTGATWMNGELRLATGNVVRYVHDAFGSEFETEIMVPVKQGLVSDDVLFIEKKKKSLKEL